MNPLMQRKKSAERKYNKMKEAHNDYIIDNETDVKHDRLSLLFPPS